MLLLLIVIIMIVKMIVKMMMVVVVVLEVWKPPKVAATVADAHLFAENQKTAEHPGEEIKHVNIIKNNCVIAVILV
jgi:hypothetical protein